MKSILKHIIPILLAASLNVLIAKVPDSGLVMLDVNRLEKITSKVTADNEHLTFEELIEAGINGLYYNVQNLANNDYNKGEWWHEAHEYGIWVCGGVDGNQGQAALINDAIIAAALGSDFIQIYEPFKGPGEGCVGKVDAFIESAYKQIQDAVGILNANCPVIIADAGCTAQLTGWASLDGLFGEVYGQSDFTSYYPDMVDYAQNNSTAFTGAMVWMSSQTGGTAVSDTEISNWFTTAYTDLGNVIWHNFHTRDDANWSGRVQLINSVVSKASSVPQWQNFSPATTIARSAPDVQVQVKSAEGLDPASVECYYAIHPID
ncbi:MAG: hypothetical protein HQK83_17430, partial [Fibrobacteria bacterium]|nr:hypothetical protein [Fibrobacteria bacterium]